MRGIVRSFLTGLLLQACLHHSLLAQAPSNSPDATRSLVVNVVDSRGVPIRDLTSENFALLLNGKPAVVTNAQYRIASHRIVVLLDVSGSMLGATSSGKWRLAVEAVRDLLLEVDSHVPIAMVTFASGIQETLDFGQGRTAILNWLVQNADRPPKIKKKRTALFDAIASALRLLDSPQTGDAIYAITDGADNASGFTAQTMEEDLLKSGVRLFSLLFIGPVDPQEAEAEDSFAGMIQDSGGQAFVVPGFRIHGVPWDAQYNYDRVTRENLKAYTTDLNIQINGFWTLGLIGPISFPKSKVKLVVTDSTKKELKNVIVTYPHILLSVK